MLVIIGWSKEHAGRETLRLDWPNRGGPPRGCNLLPRHLAVASMLHALSPAATALTPGGMDVKRGTPGVRHAGAPQPGVANALAGERETSRGKRCMPMPGWAPLRRLREWADHPEERGWRLCGTAVYLVHAVPQPVRLQGRAPHPLAELVQHGPAGGVERVAHGHKALQQVVVRVAVWQTGGSAGARLGWLTGGANDHNEDMKPGHAHSWAGAVPEQQSAGAPPQLCALTVVLQQRDACRQGRQRRGGNSPW